IIDDGMNFVQKTDRRFDVIIVDSTDPQGPGAVLFTYDFYAACKRCMGAGAIMVTQNGVPFFQPGELISSVGHFRRLFVDAGCYVAAIPTYVGGHMAMGWAADDPKSRTVAVETLAERHARAGAFPTRYWTPDVHRAAFALPRFIADAVEKARAGAKPKRLRHTAGRRVAFGDAERLGQSRPAAVPAPASRAVGAMLGLAATRSADLFREIDKRAADLRIRNVRIGADETHGPGGF